MCGGDRAEEEEEEEVEVWHCECESSVCAKFGFLICMNLYTYT